MTRTDEKKLAQSGNTNTTLGDASAACRDGFQLMHPTPGAVPSKEMIEALRPDRVKQATDYAGWQALANSFGMPDAQPDQALSMVHYLIENISIEERAQIAQEQALEVFCLLSFAYEYHPEISTDITEQFPGLREAFEGAADRYGDAAMMDATGITIH